MPRKVQLLYWNIMALWFHEFFEVKVEDLRKDISLHLFGIFKREL
mgnify:CR=1 FL=1